MEKDSIEKILSRFPFLSYGIYNNEDYIGIIQFSDNIITTFYTYNKIGNYEMRKRFLELGNIWWWESNRKIPINLFLKEEFKIFKPYLKTFLTKDFKLIVNNHNYKYDVKKIKRKTIRLSI